MPAWGHIVDKLTRDMPITSIYGWTQDRNMTVVYADGALKSYLYFDELNTCFISESFKFSDFWKVLVGFSSLIGVCMTVISMFLIDTVDYQQIQKPDDEEIPLSNIDSM
ncbi:hypothetical protein BGZ74_003280 [Mortierella antarctica]|nr:hypothetical protein BGZ74_003280 [Mortierella antarctica]